MPGLVQAAVSTELFKGAGRGRGGQPQQAPQLGQLLDGPPQCPPLSPRGQDLVTAPPRAAGAAPVFSGHTQSHTADAEKNMNLLLDFK